MADALPPQPARLRCDLTAKYPICFPRMARVTAQDFYDYDKCPHRVYLNRFGDPKEKLPQSDFLNLLFERALDQTRMVRCSGRGAVPALSKKVNSVGGQRLWEIFDSCRYPHGK